MKKFLLVAGILLGAFTPGAAFAAFPSDEIQVLAPKDIALLADDKITDVYIDVLVEMEAVKTFHATSGFTPKEYSRYKELLKYRLLLRLEIQRRKLEIPSEVN